MSICFTQRREFSSQLALQQSKYGARPLFFHVNDFLPMELDLCGSSGDDEGTTWTRHRQRRGDWTGLKRSSSSSNPAHGRAKGETGNRRSDCGGEQPREAPAPSFSLQLGGMYHLHTDALSLCLYLFLFFHAVFYDIPGAIDRQRGVVAAWCFTIESERGEEEG